MRNIHIAEWILGLVTNRDRAACTAGDFAQEAAARGVVWFWSGVLRTATSLLWHGVAENPVRVTGVALIGLAIDVAASLLIAAFTGGLFFFAVPGHPVSFVCLVIALDAPPLVMLLLIGRMLARWAPGHELSACLVYAIAGLIFYLIGDLVDPGGLGFSALLWVFLGDAAQRTLVLAGAMWGRHRRLAAR